MWRAGASRPSAADGREGAAAAAAATVRYGRRSTEGERLGILTLKGIRRRESPVKGIATTGGFQGGIIHFTRDLCYEGDYYFGWITVMAGLPRDYSSDVGLRGSYCYIRSLRGDCEQGMDLIESYKRNLKGITNMEGIQRGIFFYRE